MFNKIIIFLIVAIIVSTLWALIGVHEDRLTAHKDRLTAIETRLEVIELNQADENGE